MSHEKSHQVSLLVLGALVLTGCADLAIDTQSLLVPTMQRSELVGMVAGFGTTFAGLPDLVAMLRKRSTQGMNPRMAAIMFVFQLLWIWYGLLIASRPVIAWNTIAVIVNVLVVGSYLFFKRAESKAAPTA